MPYVNTPWNAPRMSVDTLVVYTEATIGDPSPATGPRWP